MKKQVLTTKEWKAKQNEHHAMIRHGLFIKTPQTYTFLFGLEVAAVMGYIEQLDYQTSAKRKTRWLYITNDTFYRTLMLSAAKVLKITNLLKKYNLIFTKLKGTPPIKYYAINYEMTLEVAKTVNFSKIKKLNSLKLRNLILENKEILLLRKNYLDTSLLLDTDIDKSISVRPAKRNGHSHSNVKGKEVDPSYLKLAKKLSKIVHTQKNIVHTPLQIRVWSNSFKQLDTINKVDISRQKAALKWYKKAVGGEYIPVVESGKSFREKFTKLEDAMNRKDFTNKPKLNNAYKDDFKLTKKSIKV